MQNRFMASVRIFVSDIEKSKAFYIDALGFELADQCGPAFAIVRRGDLDLWLSSLNTSAAKVWADGTQPMPGGFTRIVLPIKNWEEQLAKIELRLGRIANGPIDGPGGTQIIVSDPDGNTIEFFK